MSDNNTTNRTKLLNCKANTTIATLNTRTLRIRKTRDELVHQFLDSKIDILGIQEHRILHEEPFRYEQNYSTEMITASAWRSEAGAAIGGVGILLSAKAKKAFLNIEKVNNRIIVAHFDGNPKTTVIVTYSPTNAEDETVIDNYYDTLKDAIDKIPMHNVLLVIGDLNARVGLDDCSFSYHAETNRNGNKLVELTLEKNLILCNTSFQKNKSKLWTFMSPKGLKYQLDYILIRRKWRNSVKNAQAYNNFASVGSDHRIVSARLKLSLRANNKSIAKKTRYDLKALSSDQSFRRGTRLK